MATLVKMPRLGLTMTEGVIVKWLKQEGDAVAKGEELVEIESDKSTVSFESPEEGVLLKMLAQEGDTVECQADIAAIGAEGESFVYEGEGEGCSVSLEPAGKSAARQDLEEENTAAAAPQGEKVFASPAARRAARELDVDVCQIPIAKGKVRLSRADVEEYAISHKVKATPLAKKIAEAQGIDLRERKAYGTRIYSEDLALRIAPKAAASEERRIPVAGMRKVIAARMKASIETAAHISLSTEVDMSAAYELRGQLMTAISEKYGVRVSVNDLIIKCTAQALCEYPRVNSVFTEKEVIERADIHIGMAVALPEGLVVPVLHNADRLSVGQIAQVSKRLAAKAKNEGLSPDEMTGGTFTVSNLGMFGITQFTSIINQPESAILSVAQAIRKPVVIEGRIEIRPIMNLTINFDHRPMDGSTAALFLGRLKSLLENPWELLV